MAIKVLHFAGVINRFDFIDTVLTELDREEFEVEAVTVSEARNRIGGYSENERYRTTCLQLTSVRGNWLRCYRALAAKVKEFKPDILHTHHFDETVIGAILVRMDLVPKLVVGHHYSDHIYVLTRGVKRKFYLAIERWCNRKASRIVVPSQEVFDLLVSQGEDAAKLETIPYGTDPNQGRSVEKNKVKSLKKEFDLDEKFVVVTTCRLNPEKGLQHLLKAVPDIIKLVPNFRLLMAGDGAIAGDLKAMVKDLAIQKYVTFLGWRSDVLEWISLADCVVQPSLSESFCQVVVESLILETPIVVTPVGVAPEAIISGERGGILVPIGSHKEIAEAVVRLSADTEYRKKLGQSGRDFIISSFSLRATASKHEAVYRSIC